MPESCYDEFEIVRNNLNKQGGQTYYHMIQSFAQDDNISPENVMKSVCKWLSIALLRTQTD